MGAEWVIVIFVALILILGTGKMPAAARKLGKAVAEFESAKKSVVEELTNNNNIRVSGPVDDERAKLEAMARSVGIDPGNISDDDLRQAIRDKMG